MTALKHKRKRLEFKNIDLIVYDFDGVMTDNRVLVFDDGQEAVWCNRADGLAISLIKKAGIPQIILSMEENPVVEIRAHKLGIDVFYAIEDKKTVLMDYCRKSNYDLKKVVYVGNDINDLEAMKLVGYAFAPQDANIQVKNIAMIVTEKKGGDGVIKEIYDQFLNLS